jgi:cytochrome c
MYTFNIIAGWVLGACLFVFGLQAVSGAIYHVEGPSAEKPGYLIEVVESGDNNNGGGDQPVVSIGTLLASADATKGQAEAKACTACHVLEKGGANKTGPALWDVVERGIGSVAGFAYSAGALEKASEKWTYENLNNFIKNPKGYISGTKMAFGGIKNDAKRANLIAYLATLSDAPKPFPAP